MYVVVGILNDIEFFFCKEGFMDSNIHLAYQFEKAEDADVAAKCLDYHNDGSTEYFCRKL